MKIRCLSAGNANVTQGKIYECNLMKHEFELIGPYGLIDIKDDRGDVVYMSQWRFEQVNEELEAIKLLDETEEQPQSKKVPVAVTLGEYERVNHPKHYTAGKYEVIDVIEDWNLGFNLGNVIKYIARAEHKDNKLEDLKKAKWYLEREIQNLEKEWYKDIEF